MSAWKRVALVGATGAVGREFDHLLTERNFPAREYRLFASPRSAGKTISWCNANQKLHALADDCFTDCDLAFFSAGAALSREWAPRAQAAGAIVIDNSSTFRLDPHVPLVVPEINAHLLTRRPPLIANPNCSTIILAVALAPLQSAARLRRVTVSTYQAVSGAGAQALANLESQTRAALEPANRTPAPADREPYAFNVFSHDSNILDDGFNVEERKLIDETRKIFALPTLPVVPTCLRVPVRRAHLESVAIECEQPLTLAAARAALAAAPGVRIVDDRTTNQFPSTLRAAHQDDVLVGRLRHDPTIPDERGLLFICASDQLRKGAALNAIQIAEALKPPRD